MSGCNDSALGIPLVAHHLDEVLALLPGLSENETAHCPPCLGIRTEAMTQTMPQARGAFGQSAFEDGNCSVDGKK